MKTTLFILLLSIGFFQVKAQLNKELVKFYKIQDSAAYFEAAGKDDQAIKYYKKLLTFKQFEVRNDIYKAIAQVYLRQDNLELAKEYLTKFILNAGPIEKDWFKYQYHDKIKLNIDSLNNKFRFNYALYNQIHKNLYEDQTLRKIDMTLRKDTTVNKDMRSKLFDYYDSIYCEAVKKIVVELDHIPTSKEIGWQMQNVFENVLTSHHLYKDTAFWMPYYRAAVNNGTVSRITIPFLIDLNQVKKGEKVFYGAYFNFENPAQMLEPLYPDKIDVLRAEYYLPPLYMQTLIDKIDLPENYHYEK